MSVEAIVSRLVADVGAQPCQIPVLPRAVRSMAQRSDGSLLLETNSGEAVVYTPQEAPHVIQALHDAGFLAVRTLTPDVLFVPRLTHTENPFGIKLVFVEAGRDG